MKSFLSYLREDLLKSRGVAWQAPVFAMVFTHSYPDWIPITSKTSEVLFGKLQKVHAIHVTDLRGLKTLLSISGTKKTISSTTTIDYSSVYSGSGIHRSGIIACITGDFVIGHHTDFMTVPDDNGRRWVNLLHLDSNLLFDLSWIKNFFRDCSLMKRDIMKRYDDVLNRDTDAHIKKAHTDNDDPYGRPLYRNETDGNYDYQETWSSFGAACQRHENRKIIGTVIKDYVDGMNKLVLRYQGPFADLFSSHTQDEIRYYNEILLNNIQIKGIYALDYSIDTDLLQSTVGGKFPIVFFNSDHNVQNRKDSLKEFTKTGIFTSPARPS